MDTLQKFLFKEHAIRGQVVRLDQSLKTIIAQHGYPVSVGHMLSEVLVATVLLTGTMKISGKLVAQIQNEGDLRMLVAKCDHELGIAGVAKWQEDATFGVDPIELNQGKLVVTVFNEKNVQPYQSIIPFSGTSVANVLTDYFTQSEQLPSIFAITLREGQAIGLMLQVLPDATPEARSAFFADIMAGLSLDVDEVWSANDNATLIQSIFPEHDIELFAEDNVKFHCGCSEERAMNAVVAMGANEVETLLAEKKVIDVNCDFCGVQYVFDRDKLEDFFQKHKRQ